MSNITNLNKRFNFPVVKNNKVKIFIPFIKERNSIGKLLPIKIKFKKRCKRQLTYLFEHKNNINNLKYKESSWEYNINKVKFKNDVSWKQISKNQIYKSKLNPLKLNKSVFNKKLKNRMSNISQNNCDFWYKNTNKNKKYSWNNLLSKKYNKKFLK